jgi:hypothetical protein
VLTLPSRVPVSPPLPAVRVSPPLPAVVRANDLLVVTGRVLHAPAGTDAVLESKQALGWRILARRHVGKRRGLFTLRWRVVVKASTPVSLRVAALEGHRLLAATAPQQELVGPAPVYCHAPTPPTVVPAGDGWITGGVYFAGGPAPGLYGCERGRHTVTATNRAGMVVATVLVAAGRSYTLVLAPGRYELASGFCRGSATVRAGKATRADTVCAVP